MSARLTFSLTFTIFFFISGGVLYHNNNRINSLKRFYYKRWKAIYPMFYVAWLWQYFERVIANHSFFYKESISPFRFVFTILGIDGYFLYRFNNYYILGEWFLGAIVLLYMFYPCFLHGVNKMSWKVLEIIVPLLIFQIHMPCFEISARRNLIYCSTIFLLGMLCFKYKLYEKSYIKSASCIICFAYLCIPVGNNIYFELIFCLSTFFVLYSVATSIMRLSLCRKLFHFLADLSFPIFLVQNIVGSSIVESFIPSTVEGVVKAIVFAVFLCIVYAWCLKAIIHAVFKTTLFRKLDHYFLDRNIK